jgi:hypothetical protein
MNLLTFHIRTWSGLLFLSINRGEGNVSHGHPVVILHSILLRTRRRQCSPVSIHGGRGKDILLM